MFVEVSTDGAVLREPDGVTRFHVVAGAGPDDSGPDRTLHVDGVGYLMGQAAFVRSSWLRTHDDRSAEWRAKLDGMLAYTATRGWIRDGHVQVHVAHGEQLD